MNLSSMKWDDERETKLINIREIIDEIYPGSLFEEALKQPILTKPLSFLGDKDGLIGQLENCITMYLHDVEKDIDRQRSNKSPKERVSAFQKALDNLAKRHWEIRFDDITDSFIENALFQEQLRYEVYDHLVSRCAVCDFYPRSRGNSEKEEFYPCVDECKKYGDWLNVYEELSEKDVRKALKNAEKETLGRFRTLMDELSFYQAAIRNSSIDGFPKPGNRENTIIMSFIGRVDRRMKWALGGLHKVSYGERSRFPRLISQLLALVKDPISEATIREKIKKYKASGTF